MSAQWRPCNVRRPMVARDVDEVVTVEGTAYRFPWTRGNFIDSLASGYLAEVLHPSAAGPGPLLAYFVAMVGVDELHLLNITVSPAWQGRGLGSDLLGAVQALGRARALANLWLEVRESNHRARSLYRRRGFAEVGLRRGYYPADGRREDAIVMSLPLGQGSAERGLV